MKSRHKCPEKNSTAFDKLLIRVLSYRSLLDKKVQIIPAKPKALHTIPAIGFPIEFAWCVPIKLPSAVFFPGYFVIKL